MCGDDVIATTEQAVKQLGCLRGLVTRGLFGCQRERVAVQAAIPHLTASRGAIVTLGSVSAFIGSRTTVLSFTYAAAGELASRGIRVNNVAPGWVDGGAATGCFASVDVAHAVTWLLQASNPWWIHGSASG